MSDYLQNDTDSKSASPRAGAAGQLALIGLFAALCCILGPLTVPLPISPVPVSLINLVIFFSVYILGRRRGTLSYLVYVLIGLVGLPVFSSFTGGPGRLFGPTGGYMIGFIFMGIVCGFFIEKWPQNMLLCFLGMVLGMAVCYGFGSLWLAYQSGVSFSLALMQGVIPFIPGDPTKIIAAMLLGPQLRKRLGKAGLL